MKLQKDSDRVLIIDFGSQVTKLIARRIRELGVYSEIITPKALTRLKKYHDIKGIILSGGPSTVTSKKFESVPKELFEKKQGQLFDWLVSIVYYFLDNLD